jgi:hypothetical protein
MNNTQYNSIHTLKSRIDELTTELTFINRPETLRYTFTECSYRTFNYNDYSTEMVALLNYLLNQELSTLQTQFNNIIVSGSL